jgi:hypothetical protein
MGLVEGGKITLKEVREKIDVRYQAGNVPLAAEPEYISRKGKKI